MYTDKDTLIKLKHNTLDLVNQFAKLTEQYLSVVIGEGSNQSHLHSNASNSATSNANGDNSPAHLLGSGDESILTFLVEKSRQDGAGKHLLKELMKMDEKIKKNVQEMNAIQSYSIEFENSRKKLEDMIKSIEIYLKPYEDLQGKMQEMLFYCKQYKEYQSKKSNGVSLLDLWQGLDIGNIKESQKMIFPWMVQLGKTTFSPPGIELPRWYFPPAPQEDMIRASLLYRHQINNQSGISKDIEFMSIESKVESTSLAPQSQGVFSTQSAAEHLLGGEEDWLFET
jgi:hypothetical protein